jgi:hypothetical protein
MSACLQANFCYVAGEADNYQCIPEDDGLFAASKVLGTPLWDGLSHPINCCWMAYSLPQAITASTKQSPLEHQVYGIIQRFNKQVL